MMDCKPKDSLTARLNRRIVIQSPPTGRDEYGQPSTTWTDVIAVWAAIEPLRGNEYFAADRDNAEVKTRIRIRYRTGVDRTMRVKYVDAGVTTYFEILDIIHPKMAKVELQLMCKERQ